MSVSSQTIGVVGAGLAGLVVARRLKEAGAHVRVFEKSRGPGGRLATRRVRETGPAEGFEYDHGAPAVHASTPHFASFLQGLEAAGALAAWPEADAFFGAPTFVGAARMNNAPAALAEGLDIQLQATVKTIVRDGAAWRVDFEDAKGAVQSAAFDRIVVAAPAPQTAVIAAGVPALAAAAEAARYDPCWTVILSAVGRPGLSGGAPVMRFAEASGGALDMVICNGAKPGRGSGDGAAPTTHWVAHATPAWSATHLEAEREDVLDMLRPQICSAIGADADAVAYMTAHRWRYARVAAPFGQPFAASADETAFAVGDWCLGGDAEHAFESAHALSMHIAGM